MEISFYIFYHDASKIAEFSHLFDDERFNFINLNELDLPDSMRVRELPEKVNKALYSEYLGLLKIKPKSRIVGFFTYSIPKKYSRTWAQYTGCYNLFLPEIKFDLLTDCYFDKQKIYAVEFNDPLNCFREIIKEIHRKFKVGTREISKRGPYKGSFIIETNKFLSFQKWFEGVIQFVVSNYSCKNWHNLNSQFSLSDIANKSEEEKETDKLRHGIGDILERSVAYYFAQSFDENEKIKLGEYLYECNRSRHLKQVLSQHSSNNLVIIVFANFKYLQILKNWLFSIKKLNINNFLVISLDKKLYNYLNTNDIPTYYVDSNDNLSDLWLQRVLLFKQIINLGFNFIHSDADAVWLRNPIDSFFSSTDCDMIFSQGTIWPRDIYYKWGFVLCCGLFYIKASKKMGAFLSKVVDDVKTSKDDQISFNRVIYHSKISWNISAQYENRYRKFKIISSREIIIGSDGLLRVDVLPHHLFQRILIRNEKPYVVHPLSEKTSDSTKKVLKKASCYFIKEDHKLLKRCKHFIKRIYFQSIHKFY